MLAPTPLSRLAEVLQAFKLHLISARPIAGGFSGARVWHAETSPNHSVAVRCSIINHPEDLRKRSEICRWMLFAQTHGCAWAPRPHSTSSSTANQPQGDFLLMQPDGWWQVEDWMPGQPANPTPSHSQLHAALAALQQLHQSGRDYASQRKHQPGNSENPTPLSPSTLALSSAPSPGLARRLEIVRTLHAGELQRLLANAQKDPDQEFRELSMLLADRLKQRLEILRQKLELLAPRPFTLQPVLRDVWFPHVLFSSQSVSGIIDWNAAHTEHPAFDYSRLLASWFGRSAHTILPQPNAIHLTHTPGSDSPHSLPQHWTAAEHQLLHTALEASTLLSPITWLQRRCANGPPTHTATPELLQHYRRLVQLATHH